MFLMRGAAARPEPVAMTASRSGGLHNTSAIVYIGFLKYPDLWKPDSDILKEQWNLLI